MVNTENYAGAGSQRTLPIMKITLRQGRIVGELLRVTNKKPIRSISEVVGEMKEKYKDDYVRRGGEWPVEIEKQQKRIDTEHSYVVEFCKAFDLISYQEKDVMCTFFGRKLLSTMNEYECDDIFDNTLADYLGKIFLNIDTKKWGIVKSLTANPNGMTAISVLSVSGKTGVNVDRSSLEERLKRTSINTLRKRWKAEFGNQPMDWMWMKKNLKREIEPRINERLTHIVESILRLFKHVGMVVKNGDKWYADSDRLDCLRTLSYWREESSISYEEFFIALFKSHKDWSLNLGARDVPIPLIRNDVCWKLGIPWDAFDSFIENAPLDHKGMMISFSQSRFPRRWGIIKNSRNMYYLSIQNRHGE
jgi:hypothetical protein